MIFLQYFYNVFARRVFTIAFTIFLAERFYDIFTNTLIQDSYAVSPFSFYSFYNVHTQGKMGVAGSPLYIHYEFLLFS